MINLNETPRFYNLSYLFIYLQHCFNRQMSCSIYNCFIIKSNYALTSIFFISFKNNVNLKVEFLHACTLILLYRNYYV